MFYKGELELLEDTLRRMRIPVMLTDATAPLSQIISPEFSTLLEENPLSEISIGEYLGKIEPQTLYHTYDTLGFRYAYLLLPAISRGNLLFIGPFLHASPGEAEIYTLAEGAGIPPRLQKPFRDYYMSITCLSESSPAFLMLEAFCDRIWGRGNYIRRDREPDNRRLLYSREAVESDGIDSALMDAMLISKRYAYENELLQAISLGQTHRIEHLMAKLEPESFDIRVPDPLRNFKNYCIIMNTLFRKAAEQGGVHPVHLHRISSGFAAEIEQQQDITSAGELMRSIFRTYSRLVRTNTMRNCSEHVQQALLIIESELASPLSLADIARALSISPTHLARIFHRDTGKTVVEHIQDMRIRQACHLLKTTNLQIQTVAQHCGMMDVQYFSKIFKKITGSTPKVWREQARGGAKEVTL